MSYEKVRVRIDKWSFGWRLPKEKLKKMSTQRLLDLLKKVVRPYAAGYGWLVGIEGDDSYAPFYDFYDNYRQDIKDILKDRPHLEKKKKKFGRKGRNNG